MQAQPEHSDILNFVHPLCKLTIYEVKSTLTKQRELNAGKAKRKDDKAWVKEEMAWEKAECEKRERQEKAKKLAQNKLNIQAAERDLLAWKQAYDNTQRGAAAVDSGNEDDNDNIKSIVKEAKVCSHIFIISH